jgi:hypothetical protein
MDPAVYLFWTGDAVVTPRITRRAAAHLRRVSWQQDSLQKGT